MATLLDIVFAALVMITLTVSVLTMLSDSARDALARAYARQFDARTETDCPTTFGNAFWFACASEARRINPARLARAAVAPPVTAPPRPAPAK
jgi:hypothetical protein